MSYFGTPNGRPRAIRIPIHVVNVEPYTYNTPQDRELVRRASAAALKQGNGYNTSWAFDSEQYMMRLDTVRIPLPLLEDSLGKPLPPTPTPRVIPELHYLDVTPRPSLLNTSNTNSYCHRLREPTEPGMAGLSNMSRRSNSSHISTSTRSSLRRKAPIQDLRRQASVSSSFSPPQSRTVSGVTVPSLPSSTSSKSWTRRSRAVSGATYSTRASLGPWISQPHIVSGQTFSTNASSDPWVALADADSGYGTSTEREARCRPPSTESTSISLPRPSLESTAISGASVWTPERLANATPSQYLGYEQFRTSYESNVNEPNNPRLSEEGEVGEPLTSAFSWSDNGRDDVKQNVKDAVKWVKGKWLTQRRWS